MVGERMKPEMTEFLQNKQNSKQVWEGCEGTYVWLEVQDSFLESKILVEI